MQYVNPATVLYCPGGHCVQLLDESTGEYRPAAHGVHKELPVPELVPARHEAQIVSPLVPLYFPATHSTHALPAMAEY